MNLLHANPLSGDNGIASGKGRDSKQSRNGKSV